MLKLNCLGCDLRKCLIRYGIVVIVLGVILIQINIIGLFIAKSRDDILEHKTSLGANILCLLTRTSMVYGAYKIFGLLLIITNIYELCTAETRHHALQHKMSLGGNLLCLFTRISMVYGAHKFRLTGDKMGMPKTICCSNDMRKGLIIYGLVVISFVFLFIITNVVQVFTAKSEDHALEQRMSLGINTLGLITRISMVYGAYKKSRPFLLPYLILECLGLALSTLFCAIFIFTLPVFIVFVPIIALFWYIWLCVLSYYQQLGIPEQPQQPVIEVPPPVYMEQPPSYTQAESKSGMNIV